jgi:hypothetical protein
MTGTEALASWLDLLDAADALQQEAFKKKPSSLWCDIWNRRAKNLRRAGERMRHGTKLGNLHFDSDDLLRAAEHPPEGVDPDEWKERFLATDRKYKQLIAERG